MLFYEFFNAVVCTTNTKDNFDEMLKHPEVTSKEFTMA